MPLAAAQIIDAIAARMTGLPLAGARVFTSRAWPLAEDALPAWRVLAANEDIEPTTVHPNARQEHRLQVELVRRYREGKADERVQRGIHISINGIAAGLRNTG